MSRGIPAAAVLDAARARDLRVIAVAGTAKNAGKTVMTAALLAELARRGDAHGVLSLGRDGESADALDGRAKPALQLAAGALAVVARTALRAGLPCELVAELGESSALGELVAVRAAAPVRIEIAGPPSARQVEAAIELLHMHGARIVVVDGALDRLTALNRLAAGFVIATGAASARSLSAAAARAEAVVARLRMPAPPEGLACTEIAGVLDARLFEELTRENATRPLLVDEPLRVTRDAFALARRGARLYARQAYDVLACSVNAFAIERCFDPLALAAAVATATGLPTVDCYRNSVTLP